MSHCFSVIMLRSFFFSLAVPDLQFRALVILCSFCLAILSPRPSTSPAATPFSAYVCLILGGVVCPGLGVWGVMLRDFQLMGWRGWEGERGEERGGYRKEKRPSRWASKVFWSRKHRGGLFTTERDGQSRMETEKTSVECWEFIFHEKLHSFAPAYWTAVLKSFLLQKAIELCIKMMSWTLFGFH